MSFHEFEVDLSRHVFYKFFLAIYLFMFSDMNFSSEFVVI